LGIKGAGPERGCACPEEKDVGEAEWPEDALGGLGQFDQEPPVGGDTDAEEEVIGTVGKSASICSTESRDTPPPEGDDAGMPGWPEDGGKSYPGGSEVERADGPSPGEDDKGPNELPQADPEKSMASMGDGGCLPSGAAGNDDGEGCMP
jgi:hypothetical protein